MYTLVSTHCSLLAKLFIHDFQSLDNRRHENVSDTEMQKVADAADMSVLFFSAGANFWAILGHFWAILAILGHFWANLGNFLGYFV